MPSGNHANRAACAAGVTAIGVAAIYLFARPRQLRWGASGQERDAPLPGDDLIVTPGLTATRAITVRAPASQAWPWIAQLGQGRGGFYSYDFLENLAGCDIHSADRLIPEWQNIKIGDDIKLAPQVGLDVAAPEPGRSLVLRGGITLATTPPPYDFTWAWVLHDAPDGTTRLLLRERYGYTKAWARLLIEPVEGVSFLMSQKTLRGIRDRAEQAASPRNLPAGASADNARGTASEDHEPCPPPSADPDYGSRIIPCQRPIPLPLPSLASVCSRSPCSADWRHRRPAGHR